MTTIRAGTMEDCDKIGALQVKTWLETYRGLVPNSVLDSMSTVEQAQSWKRILGRTPPGMLVVAETAGGKLIGFAGGGVRRGSRLPHDSEVYALYVLGAVQRQGLGRRLMAAAARGLRDQGGGSLCLWVLRENLPARQFYEALGGIMVGEKFDTMAGRKLPMVAYGWENIGRFIDGAEAAVPVEPS